MSDELQEGHAVKPIPTADYATLRETVDPERIYRTKDGKECIFDEYAFDKPSVVFVEEWSEEL